MLANIDIFCKNKKQGRGRPLALRNDSMSVQKISIDRRDRRNFGNKTRCFYCSTIVGFENLSLNPHRTHALFKLQARIIFPQVRVGQNITGGA
jgi:hypothetical protein